MRDDDYEMSAADYVEFVGGADQFATITAADYRRMMGDGPPTPATNKFLNKPTTIDGITFDSATEARRYQELKQLEKYGEIFELERQPRFPIEVNGHKITRYTADFRYRDKDGVVHVEDVKSPRTAQDRAYIIRRKLLFACHGITVEEVTA